jgi:TRAP-type C4-dicarboxylate transport system permease small subunit
MPLLEKYVRINEKISFWIEWIGLAGLLMMMLITCFDVIGAKVFRLPIPGALDIVMISQLLAVSFAIAASLILGRHVEVEFFVPLLPTSLQAIVDSFINLCCMLLFAVISWRLFVYGFSMQTGNEVSPTIRIPLYGFAYGVGLSCIPVCLIYMNRLILSILRIIKK